MSKDYYQVLGLPRDATDGEIEDAHRELSARYRDAKAEAKLKHVKNAYDVLSDEVKRREYDEQISEDVEEVADDAEDVRPKSPPRRQRNGKMESQKPQFNWKWIAIGAAGTIGVILFVTVIMLMMGGGGATGSYTARALDEYQRGNAYDFHTKNKRPSTKAIAAVEKKVKSYPAGSKRDFFQALQILSNHRDHDEQTFTTIAKSSFLRESYTRVFGEPESVNTKEEPNRWSHTCNDGKVTMKGYWKVKDEPKYLTTYPQKPNF